MAPNRHAASVEEVIEGLFDAADAADRARVLLVSLRARTGAQAVGLCRPIAARREQQPPTESNGPNEIEPLPEREWAHIAVEGDAAHLPTCDQVEAVVSGELPALLPPGRAVVVASATLAIAIDGLFGDSEELEDLLDEVEGLTVVYEALARHEVADDGIDEVPPALGAA